MSKQRKLHAAALNTLARLFGAGAILIGGIFAIWGLSLVLNKNATINNNGVPTNDPWIKGSVLVVGLVAITVGILVLKAKRYQPKG